MSAAQHVGAFEGTEEFAGKMDAEDGLARFRGEFLIPPAPGGSLGSGESGEAIYLCGNSLGLQPRRARRYIEEELEDWARLGVEGHLHARHPWLPYHEFLTESTARLVGALPSEVVTMNSLTVNVHLLMVSFYRPTRERFKILVEGGAFPSDQYAVASQARLHGFDPEQAILELKPREGEWTLRPEDILEAIEREGDRIALIWLGNVNYLTGQRFDIRAITEAGRRKGCRVGFDLAHGAGNLLLRLHDWGVDCAAWCGYKYLNGGPGAIAGAFVHERWLADPRMPRFAGWWGHNKQDRFKMEQVFDPIPTAEAWQLSNPPILQLAALRASMEIFDAATIEAVRRKGDRLTGYLEFLLSGASAKAFEVITPADRGCQLSLKVRAGARKLRDALAASGVIADFREPDIVRVAPAPLYNSFLDVHRFAAILGKHAAAKG